MDCVRIGDDHPAARENVFSHLRHNHLAMIYFTAKTSTKVAFELVFATPFRRRNPVLLRILAGDRRVSCPFGLRLCITLTHGCPTLVAVFWRQGGYNPHSECRLSIVQAEF